MFMKGNVIKTKEGSIEIVTDVTDSYTQTISVDSVNCSAGYRQKTYAEPRECGCGEDDCSICNGDEVEMVTRYGMEDATLLAPTVKDWIVKSLTKNFGF